MNEWEVLGRERAPEGGEMILLQCGESFMIRVGDRELMSSHASHSEEEMSRIVAARLASRPAPRVLIGGLGMGFTTRAALDALPPGAEVVVAEIVPAVVAWNRGPLAHLARRPLDDPRARVEVIDVARFIAQTKVRFDAILLDVDNGPEGLTRAANSLLYTDRGLATARQALRPGGYLVVWAANPDVAFERRMRKGGFVTDLVTATSRGARGGRPHTLYFGAVPGF
jgi:spermidine synthase